MLFKVEKIFEFVDPKKKSFFFHKKNTHPIGKSIVEKK